MERPLQRSLENGRRYETYGLGSLDFHGFAGLWVAAGASGTFSDFESTETDKLDWFGGLYAFSDRAEDCFNSFTCGAFGGLFAKVFLHCFDQFCFIHSIKCWWVDAFSLRFLRGFAVVMDKFALSVNTNSRGSPYFSR